MRESRRFLRVEAKLAVAFECGDEGNGRTPTVRRGTLVDLSIGGCQLITSEQLPSGTELTIRIPLSTMIESVSARGKVIRCYPADGPGEYCAAVEFQDVAYDDAKRLAALVEEHLGRTQSRADAGSSHMELLRQFTRQICAATGPQSVVEDLLDAAVKATDAPTGCVMLLDRTAEFLGFAAARGPATERLREVQVRVGEGIAGLVALHGKPMNVARAQEDPRWLAELGTLTGHEPNSILATPMMFNDSVLGVLEVLDKPDSLRFSPEDMRILDVLATQAAVMLQSLRLQSSLRDAGRGPRDLWEHGTRQPSSDAGAQDPHGTVRNAMAICLAGCERPGFTAEAHRLLTEMDPTGVLRYEVENLLAFALGSDRREAMDGAEREVDVPDGRSLFIHFTAVEDDQEESIGLLARLSAHPTDE